MDKQKIAAELVKLAKSLVAVDTLSQAVGQETWRQYENSYKAVGKKSTASIKRRLSKIVSAFKKAYPDSSLKKVTYKTEPVNKAPDLRVSVGWDRRDFKIESHNAIVGYSGQANLEMGDETLEIRMFLKHKVDSKDGVEVQQKPYDGSGYVGMRYNGIYIRHEIPAWPEVQKIIEALLNGGSLDWNDLYKAGDDTPTVDDVVTFCKGFNTWFEIEVDREVVTMSSREYGSVGDESPGQTDIDEAKRLIKELKKEYGNSMRIKPEVVDEWVSVRVAIPS